MLPLQYENVHIEAHHKGFGLGTQIFNTLIRSGRATKPLLVAVSNGPEGREELFSCDFMKLYSTPLEFLDGVDRESGKRALNEVLDYLAIYGYDPTGQGAFWFDRRFRRPYLPSRIIHGDEDPLPLIEAFLERDPNCCHALAMRAYYEWLCGRYAEAERRAMGALRVNSTQVLAISVLSASFLEEGRMAEARKTAQRAADLAPGFPFTEQLLEKMNAR
ncbi:hypothetical protein ACFWJ5_02445 [Streptomyces qaidamensis]|uniref:hypothetical protein n=1 Tax=Streptomyces qaidamensis TaxID=1783515 RepID=UPI00366995B7